jgi:predicted porin
VNNSWGARAQLSHDITRLLVGTIGGSFSNFQELGGHARDYTVNGELNYSLSPDTRVYLRADYLDRESSASLQTLSPFTGSLQDVRVTLGLSHTL